MTLKDYKTQTLKDPRSKKLNFEPDGRYHHVYRITQIIEMKYYYGSQSNDRILGESYFSTSYDKEFINEQKEHPERFEYKIIKIYDNTADKMIHEAYLHKKFDVKNHSKFYNKSNQTPFGFDTTGIEVSEETRQKLRISSGSRKHSEETKRKISSSNKGNILGPISEEKSKIISESNRKRIVKESTRRKLSKLNSGKNSPQAKRIQIFNSCGEIEGETFGNFEIFCDENSFPTAALQKSYRREGEPIYSKTKSLISWAINHNLEKFIGWHAKIILS